MKNFDIPFQYQSDFIARIKKIRETADPRKQNLSPSILYFKNLEISIARHFGFCFGVQNAIERAYQVIKENPNKRIFLLSEIIHNPEVNDDLQSKGLQFIQDTKGNQLVSWDEVTTEDIVLIPAFGTTVEIEDILKQKELLIEHFDTTCPFVERVWNKSEKLSKEGFTIIIHGDFDHEETRATFSRAQEHSAAVVVSDLNDAKKLKDFILNNGTDERDWNVFFKRKASSGFNFRTDFEKIAIVNQTTMLAEETENISNYLKDVITDKYGVKEVDEHFGSTRDTLCYATNDNQSATNELIKTTPDLAVVVGGYNSSNTTHLVELLSTSCPTYYISSEKNLLDENTIEHFDSKLQLVTTSNDYIPTKTDLKIALSSGASCPDALLERVLIKLLSFQDENADIHSAINLMEQQLNGF